MNNNFTLNKNLRTSEVINYLQNNLLNHIVENINKKLGALIAIDYDIRLKEKLILEEHLSKCAKNIKNYLGQRVIIDEDFSNAFLLFTIAINYDDSDVINKTEEQKQEISIEALIESKLPSVAPDQKIKIKSILIKILKNSNFTQVINFIDSQSELFSLITQKITNKCSDLTKQSDMLLEQLNELINKQNIIEQQQTKIRNTTRKVVTALGFCTISSIGMITGGITFSALLLPCILVTNQISNKISENISSKIIENAELFYNPTASINKLKSEINIAQKDLVKSFEVKKDLMRAPSSLIQQKEINYKSR